MEKPVITRIKQDHALLQEGFKESRQTAAYVCIGQELNFK